MRKLLLVLLSALPLMFISCNSETDKPTKPEIKTSGLNFSMTEEEFDSITVGDTRAQAAPISSELIELEGGIEAELQVFELGTHAKPRTRAISNKHYSIRAYQGGVLKGSMKGTFNGNTFTPDASSAEKMILEPGTYDFVCYNDKFQEVGNNLELGINDAKGAYICQTTEQIHASNSKQQITFNMKHAASRIQVILECYGKLSPSTATISPVSANYPNKLVYNGATNSFTQATGSIPSSNITFPASGLGLIGTGGYGWSRSEYIYFLPNTDFTKLQMKFTGGTFGENRNMSDVAAFTFTNKQWGATANPIMKQNTQYLLKITLWPGFKYLLSDGTTGTLFQSESQGKKRIGVVVQEKTASSKGLAMALKGVSEQYLVFYANLAENNTTVYPTIASLASDMDGEKWTWETSGNKGGVVRANDQSKCPGFYAAAHYDPGVPVTGANIGRWFVPSMGQLIEAFNMMERTCGYSINWSAITDWNAKTTFNRYCQSCLNRPYPLGTYNRVGEYIHGSMITSTQWEEKQFAFMHVESGDGEIYLRKWHYYGGYSQRGSIRPFVHF